MKKVIKSILMIVIVVLLWDFASKFSSPIFLPKPQMVLQSFIQMIENGMLLDALWFSFRRITIATLSSAVIAVPVGLLIHNFKFLQSTIKPIVSLLRYIPVTAFYPLLILWFGIDETMKMVFLFIATYVYMLPSVLLSFEEVNPNLIETGLTIGMSKFQTVSKILLPASLPSICKTFLMMYGIGWTYIAIAETVNAENGLGHIINVSSARGRTDLVFMSIITIMVFSVVFDKLGNLIISKTFKWRCLK